MRTEAEFIRLVEARLDAAPKRRAAAPKAVLIAATMAVLACAAVTGAVVLSRPSTELGEHDTAPAIGHAETGVPEVYFPVDTTPLPVPWEQVWNGQHYSLTRTAEPLPITTDDLGNDLGGGLWALRGVSTDYFILCKKEGYWGYVNYDYRPVTLGGLIADLNLAETLEFGALFYSGFVGGEYHAWRVEGLDTDRLWALLFAKPDSASQALKVKLDPKKIVEEATANGEVVTPPYDPSGQYIVDRMMVNDISIGISLPKLGFNDISIMLSDEDEGWLWTNLLASGNYFATSPDLVDDLLAYAREAGTWIDTTPAADEMQAGIPE
ncbi:MAG: hypothetical protein IJX53_05580 [Clostridia bacterium]|nr:hypothetical protein [Clostridia bacterium]